MKQLSVRDKFGGYVQIGTYLKYVNIKYLPGKRFWSLILDGSIRFTPYKLSRAFPHLIKCFIIFKQNNLNDQLSGPTFCWMGKLFCRLITHYISYLRRKSYPKKELRSLQNRKLLKILRKTFLNSLCFLILNCTTGNGLSFKIFNFQLSHHILTTISN